MFKRTDAIDIPLSDIADKSGIVKTIVVNDELLVLKENSIIKMMLAESIDANDDYPETRHSYTKLFDLGTTSKIISRILVQSSELLKFVDNKEKILTEIWKGNIFLINCSNSHNYLYESINKLIPECENIINENKHARYIPALPTVLELETNVNSYYQNAKLLLMQIFKLFQVFFNMPIKNRKEANFEMHIEWIKNKFGESSDLYKILDNDISWIRILSECRNAIEHQKEGQSLNIKNFSLQPDNKFSAPLLSYELSRLSIKLESLDLLNEISVTLDNLVDLYEDVIVMCIREKIKDKKTLSLFRIKDDDIDLKCPVYYTIGCNKNLINTLK